MQPPTYLSLYAMRGPTRMLQTSSRDRHQARVFQLVQTAAEETPIPPHAKAAMTRARRTFGGPTQPVLVVWPGPFQDGALVFHRPRAGVYELRHETPSPELLDGPPPAEFPGQLLGWIATGKKLWVSSHGRWHAGHDRHHGRVWQRYRMTGRGTIARQYITAYQPPANATPTWGVFPGSLAERKNRQGSLVIHTEIDHAEPTELLL